MTLRPMDVTPEIIEALRTLRAFATGPTLPNSVRAAVNTLDNAGIFAVIDEQTDYDVDPEPARTVATCNLDPAEWGDTTREDMARHQGLTYGAMEHYRYDV